MYCWICGGKKPVLEKHPVPPVPLVPPSPSTPRPPSFRSKMPNSLPNQPKSLRDMPPLKTKRDGIDYYIGDDMFENITDISAEWYDKSNEEKKEQLDDELDFYFIENETKILYSTTNLIMISCAYTAAISFHVLLVALVKSNIIRLIQT